MSDRRETVTITPVLRKAADDLLAFSDGDANEAAGMAVANADRDDFSSDAEFWFAYDLRCLCMLRANAAYEGYTLIEIIDVNPPPHKWRKIYDLEIPT